MNRRIKNFLTDTSTLLFAYTAFFIAMWVFIAFFRKEGY